MKLRCGATLVTVVLVVALVAALLPGAALAAFAVPAFTFVVLAGERTPVALVDVVFAHDDIARAPLDSRGPPRA